MSQSDIEFAKQVRQQLSNHNKAIGLEDQFGVTIAYLLEAHLNFREMNKRTTEEWNAKCQEGYPCCPKSHVL